MDLIYTPQEAADILKIHVATVKRHIREGKLKAFKAGNQWRIKESALKEYMERD